MRINLIRKIIKEEIRKQIKSESLNTRDLMKNMKEKYPNGYKLYFNVLMDEIIESPILEALLSGDDENLTEEDYDGFFMQCEMLYKRMNRNR